MNVRVQNEKKKAIKSLIIISIVYLLTHGFILVLTGIWWDENTWFYCSEKEMWEVSLQLGKPSTYYLMSTIFSLPEVVGRLLIFILYYLGTVCIYVIYRQLPCIDNRDATLMTLLYVVIPANDARAMRGVFPYTVGYFLFLLGFCLLIILQNRFGYRNVMLRIVVLLVFGSSFILNSALVFYAVPLLYILSYIVTKKKIREIYKFVDFVILPVAFFVFKNKLFPAHGLYENYNQVTMEGLFRSIYHSVKVMLYNVKEILVLWTRYIVVSVLVAAVISLICFFIFRKKGNDDRKNSKNNNRITVGYRIIIFLLGVLIMYLGIFPYSTIGQDCSLTGVAGRSSILISFGVAIIIYSLILWIPYEMIRVGSCVVAIVCGICHFNYFYLVYQQDYYRQMDLTYELKTNADVLRETKNILYLSDFEPEIGATRFYSLNACGEIAFGDQSHFIMNGVKDYNYLVDDSDTFYTFVNEGDYRMADYEIGRSTEIEAIVFYHNGLGMREALYCKFLEIMRSEKFEEHLYGENNLDVYVAGTEGFNEITRTLQKQ